MFLWKMKARIEFLHLPHQDLQPAWHPLRMAQHFQFVHWSCLNTDILFPEILCVYLRLHWGLGWALVCVLPSPFLPGSNESIQQLQEESPQKGSTQSIGNSPENTKVWAISDLKSEREGTPPAIWLTTFSKTNSKESIENFDAMCRAGSQPKDIQFPSQSQKNERCAARPLTKAIL